MSAGSSAGSSQPPAPAASCSRSLRVMLPQPHAPHVSASAAHAYCDTLVVLLTPLPFLVPSDAFLMLLMPSDAFLMLLLPPPPSSARIEWWLPVGTRIDSDRLGSSWTCKYKTHRLSLAKSGMSKDVAPCSPKQWNEDVAPYSPLHPAPLPQPHLRSRIPQYACDIS